MTAQSGLGFSGIVAIQIPIGGATGTVLTKLSAANYDYDWQPGGGGGGAPTDAEYVVLSLNATLTDERVLVGGAGLTLTDGGAGGNATLDVGAGTGITVNANDVQLDVASNLNVDHSTVVLTAGAGLTGGGDITASRTFDVGANADGSIVVNADDIQVGVLATDAQHGNRGGGGLHALAVASGAAGFISGADQQKLDDLPDWYTDYGETNGSFTTTAAGFVTAETLNFVTPAAGTYRIMWYYETKNDTLNGVTRTRVQLNGADQAFADIPIPLTVTVDIPCSGYREIALGAGAQTLTIDCFPLVGTTAEVRRRRLGVIRVA